VRERQPAAEDGDGDDVVDAEDDLERGQREERDEAIRGEEDAHGLRGILLNMSSAGLSKSRLEQLHRVLSGDVERHEMPGLVALVSHHDDVHVETLGTLSVGQPAPMRRDTIFRIASLTKPMTAVAAMILVEECRLRLDESIEPWLP